MPAPDVAITHREHIPLTLETLRLAAVALLVSVIPFNVHYDLFIQEHSPHLVGSGVQQTRLGIVDFVFVIIILASVSILAKRSTYLKQPAGQAGAAVAVAVVAIWLVIFPTIEGAVMLLRVVGVFATIVAIRHTRLVNVVPGIVWPLAIGASFQALIALSQTLLNDSGMVVPATILADGPSWTAGRGTFSGPYSLSAYLILALAVMLAFGIAARPENKRFAGLTLSIPTRVAMWTTVVLSSAAIATTFGRTVLLSIGFVTSVYVIGWLMRRSKIFAVSALATILPLLTIGTVVRSGWLVRASQTAAGDLTTRDALMGRAIEMVRESPLIGIGPVQYGPNLAHMGLPTPDVHIVHNVPLLVAVEFGVVAAIAFTVWIVVLGIRSARSSVFVLALFAFAIPFLLLDNLHYVYGNGVAGFAVWLAFLDYCSRRSHSELDSVATRREDVLTPDSGTDSTQ